MPDIDGDARQRLASKIRNTALHEHPLAGKLCRDVGAVRRHLVLADIERAEHGSLGGAFPLAVIDRIDQHRHPEHVGQQNELLADRRAFLAGAGEEVDRVFPFLEGEIGLLDIGVQRFYEFLQQEFGPRIRRVVKTADHGFGELGFVELGHFLLSCGMRDEAFSLHQCTGRR